MSKKNVAVIGDALLMLTEKLKQAEVLQLRFDPQLAKRGILRALEWVQQQRPEIEKRYPGFDLPALESLPELCDRTSAVQRAHDALSSVRDGANREMIREAMAWRRKLIPLADTLAANAKISAEVVAHIHSGRGTQDNVSDVLALVEVLAPHAQLVNAACGEDALIEAKKVATATLTRIGKASRDLLAIRAAAALRDRYGTVVFQGHERLRVLVAAMTSMKESEAIVGSLAPRSRKPKVSDAISDEPNQPEPALG